MTEKVWDKISPFDLIHPLLHLMSEMSFASLAVLRRFKNQGFYEESSSSGSQTEAKPAQPPPPTTTPPSQT